MTIRPCVIGCGRNAANTRGTCMYCYEKYRKRGELDQLPPPLSPEEIGRAGAEQQETPTSFQAVAMKFGLAVEVRITGLERDGQLGDLGPLLARAATECLAEAKLARVQEAALVRRKARYRRKLKREAEKE